MFSPQTAPENRYQSSQVRGTKWWGAQRSPAERPVARQPAYKPGSVRCRADSLPCTRRPFLSNASCPASRATYPGGRSGHRSGDRSPCRPYSVLLPVGFAVPPTLPPTRCALTAPFHPYRPVPLRRRRGDRRFVFCGTFPGVTPAGRYPAPHVHGARTFLPGDLSAHAGAAVRPTDRVGMVSGRWPVKGHGLGRAMCSRACAEQSPDARAYRGSSHRPRRPRAPGGNGAGRP